MCVLCNSPCYLLHLNISPRLPSRGGKYEGVRLKAVAPVGRQAIIHPVIAVSVREYVFEKIRCVFRMPPGFESGAEHGLDMCHISWLINPKIPYWSRIISRFAPPPRVVRKEVEASKPGEIIYVPVCA